MSNDTSIAWLPATLTFRIENNSSNSQKCATALQNHKFNTAVPENRQPLTPMINANKIDYDFSTKSDSNEIPCKTQSEGLLSLVSKSS